MRIFQIELTKEQKALIGQMLPKGMSFQTTNEGTGGRSVGRPSQKNKHRKGSQDTHKEVDLTEGKRRRCRAQDLSFQIQSKSLGGKKQQVGRCWQILKKIKKHASAWPFKSPVNTKELSIPQYSKIVLNPMDLQTIENNFKNQIYDHPSEFQRDINQMFLNSYKFNPKNDQYFLRTIELEEYYDQLMKESANDSEMKESHEKVKKKDDGIKNEHQKTTEIGELQKEMSYYLKKSTQFLIPKYSRQKTNNFPSRPQPNMTIQEKRQLGYSIRGLSPRHVERVAQILMRNKSSSVSNKQTSQSVGSIIGFDLEKVETKLLREVSNYIKLIKKGPGLEEEIPAQLQSRDGIVQVQ